ncbi:oligosaccharide flippase family protein [Paenibacillus tepidiphilus]|uniref:oligosaccharide flippase family protein n=1 Tax=Paenibacillus tepidiphilus TaxID=2608683 RepID=UPI00123C79E1|nr:oligosaccharide flippase family protein [Paenibacillus tepidiphilus]
MDEIKSFLKSSALYFVGNVLSKVILIVLLPVYTKYLQPSDYGYYDVSIAYLSIATSVLFFDIWNAVLRFMYEDENNKYKPIYSGGLIYLLSLFLYIIVLICFNYFYNIRFFEWILLYGITLTLQSFYTSITRGLGKNLTYAISGLISTFISAIVNILLIVGFGMDSSSIYIAGIISILFQVLYLEYSVKVIKRFSVKIIDKELMKKMFLFAAPLCINSLSFWLLTGYNRVAITTFLSTYENGLYSVASRIGSILTMVSMCFSLAWQEVAFSKKGSDSQKGVFFSQAFNLYFKVMTYSTVLILSFIYFLFPLIIDFSYESAKNYIPLYLMGAMLSILSNFLGTIFGNIMKTKIILISTISGAVVNALLIKPLIDKFGVNGASISLIIGFLVTIIIRSLILLRNINFKINFKFLIYSIILVGVSIIVYIKANNSMVLSAFICTFILVAIDFRMEIKKIITLLKNRKRRNTNENY